VARPVIKALQDAGHTVRGLDVESSDTVDAAFVGSVADAGLIRRAVEGTDAVIHLAAQPDDADLVDDLLEANVIGLYRVLESVRETGVPRLVMASSIQVVSGLKDQAPLGPDHANPCNRYALTKRWAEIAGEMYARKYGIQVVMARIGWLPRAIESALKIKKTGSEDIYLSDHDCGEFFLRAATSPLAANAFHIFYAVSKAPGKPRVDLGPAREIIGFQPKHTYPEGYEFTGKDVYKDSD
jgi:hypothetical protein